MRSPLLTMSNLGEGQVCPTCGGAEVSPAGVLRRHHNGWLLVLGGWILLVLWNVARKEQVQCVRCDTLYYRETRLSPIARALFILFVLLALLGLGVKIFGPSP